MNPTLLVLSVVLRLRDRIATETDRGDVPGWVMVTVMTAALVVTILGFAGNALQTLFNNAMARVTNV